MSDQLVRRAALLMVLGAGTFFLIAALLALLAWVAFGAWRSFLDEIALLAIVASIPAAYRMWSRYVVHRL